MIRAGDLLSLTIEKPASGGRMIGRHEGRVVFVSGAIPGERVTARVERLARDVAFATVSEIQEASPDRRHAIPDPLCGGCVFAHIAYQRQLIIKSEIVTDAFARIGRLALPPLRIAGSPERGYRMRARLHVRGGRAGFFREGTHEICDARPTGQLRDDTCDVLDRLVRDLNSRGDQSCRDCELEVTENADASERVVHLEFSLAGMEPAKSVALADGLIGLTASWVTGGRRTSALVAGTPFVTDELPAVNGNIRLRRHVEAFFQGNRFLLADLVAHVTRAIDHGSRVADLYAGTGLFSLAAAVNAGARVTAVEGDHISSADLEANGRQAAGLVRAVHQSVEEFVASAEDDPFDVVIVDPPRTGISRDAMAGIATLKSRRLVYVSCDPPTLARDARRLIDEGFSVSSAAAFDLFPNTPHVETVVVFDR